MLEIACFEIDSAEIALKSVADRIEFCTNVNAGGTTPNIDEFRYLREKYAKPIHVMIRATGGPFYYNDAEFEQMKKDLALFSEAGANGFVFGILEPENNINIEKNKILLDIAHGKPCVFHRAIDRTPNYFDGLEQLIDMGFSEVLTSGAANSAVAGKENLKKAVADYGDRLNILIGGGVRSSNIVELKKTTGGLRYHSSAILPYEMYANEEEIKNIKKYSL